MMLILRKENQVLKNILFQNQTENKKIEIKVKFSSIYNVDIKNKVFSKLFYFTKNIFFATTTKINHNYNSTKLLLGKRNI